MLNLQKICLSQVDNLSFDTAFNAMKIKKIFRYMTSSFSLKQ